VQSRHCVVGGAGEVRRVVGHLVNDSQLRRDLDLMGMSCVVSGDSGFESPQITRASDLRKKGVSAVIASGSRWFGVAPTEEISGTK